MLIGGIKPTTVPLESFQCDHKKHQGVVASHMPPNGDLAHNPGIRPDWESNQRPFHLQACIHSEPYQPGPKSMLWGTWIYTHAPLSFEVPQLDRQAAEHQRKMSPCALCSDIQSINALEIQVGFQGGLFILGLHKDL